MGICEQEIKSEDIFQHLIESLDDVVYRIDLESGQYQYLSPSVSDLTGCEPSRFASETDFLEILLTSEFRAGYESRRCESISTGQPCEVRYKINDATGKEKWILQTIKPHVMPSGRVIAFGGVYRDITDQYATLCELKTTQQRLETSQKITHMGNWEWNIEKDTLWWSNEIFRIFGLDSNLDEPSHAKFLNQVHRDDRTYVEDGIMAALGNRKAYNLEHRIILADGSTKTVREIGEVRFDEDKNPVFMTGTVLDITEAKKACDELASYRDKLEVMVGERTQRIETLNKDLMEVSRRAGMSEVATGILHNVGNVLNSVNTSVSLSSRNVNQMDSRGLVKVCALIMQHKGNLGYFLEETLTGRRLLEYLHRLANFQQGNFSALGEELYSLKKNVGHIEQIIAAQQTYVHARGIKQKIFLGEAIHQALVMTELYSERSPIKVSHTNQCDDEVEIEVHKLLQILVNLLLNAKDAVMDKEAAAKIITITSVCNKDKVEILVEDSGSGIERSDMDRIFSMGYTTKKEGHGFGLHTSASLATEMGGTLRVDSNGIGKGASFTLRVNRD